MCIKIYIYLLVSYQEKNRPNVSHYVINIIEKLIRLMFCELCDIELTFWAMFLDCKIHHLFLKLSCALFILYRATLNNGQKWQTRHCECNLPFARNIANQSRLQRLRQTKIFLLMGLFHIVVFWTLSIRMT